MAGFVQTSSIVKEAPNELFAGSDLEEDGVHGGRMKPLSSLGILSAKFSPSQVLTAVRVGTRAKHSTSSYGNGKRNAMIRIQRMHVRAKRCKKINSMRSVHGGSDYKLAVSCKKKALDSASDITSEGLRGSSAVLNKINSSSIETPLSCFQEQKCLDFSEKEAILPIHSSVQAATGLAPEAHLNLAKSGREESLPASTVLLKERMPGEFPLTQVGDPVNSWHTKSCIDPMLNNMLASIVKPENDDDELVAEGKDSRRVIPDSTTCKNIHVAEGYCDLSKTTLSSFELSDMLYDEYKGEKGTESFTAETGSSFQVAGNYRHACGTRLSHAPCTFSHSIDSPGLTKDIKVDRFSLERFLTTNSGMINSGVSPEKSGDSDILKQMGQLNPGIINKLRDKKQVHATLGAIIGVSTANVEKKVPFLKVESRQKTIDDENPGIDCDHEGRPAKRRKSTDFGSRLTQINLSATEGFVTTLPLMDTKTQAADVDSTTQATQTMPQVVMEVYCGTGNLNSNSCIHTGTDARVNKDHCQQSSDSVLKNLSMHKLENKPDNSGAKGQRDSRTDCLCHQTIPCQQRSHALLQVANKTTANAALCWLELLRLDVKGRLSALKRSRRRIRSVMVSGQLEDNLCCADDAIQTSRWDMAGEGKRNSQTMEVDKWRVFFLHMDSVLYSEGARLENWLSQIDDMQSQCQKST